LEESASLTYLTLEEVYAAVVLAGVGYLIVKREA
jgi:hypothetical protein